MLKRSHEEARKPWAAPEGLTGEVVSVDKGRRTMNVSPSGVHIEEG